MISLFRRAGTVLLAACVFTPLVPGAEPDGGRAIPLLASQDANSGELAGWRFYSERPNTSPGEVWRLDAAGVLSCRGTPKGYLATDEQYTNFTLRLEWRWPEKPGNGGVLLRTTGPDKIWPKSLEAQINAGAAGDFWGLGGYELTGPADRMKVVPESAFGRLTNLKRTADAEKPAGQWNQYEITARGETVTLKINGRVVNRATGCAAVPGRICLTAEGTPIELRNVEIVPAEGE